MSDLYPIVENENYRAEYHPEAQMIVFTEHIGADEGVAHISVDFVLYVLQEFQKHTPFRLMTDFSQWRGIRGS